MKNSIKNKVLFFVSLLFGLFFINAGVDKFFHYMPMPNDLPQKMLKAINAFIEIGWLMPLVGIAEMVGGLLLIIPKTRALGALVIFPVMVGIVLTNTVQDTSGLPIALTFAAILTWIMYENRAKYVALIG
ncbi:MAG: DoxX family membrane protein [Sphingobacteriales bacterium]|nr:MAG: DoxX family membrane protein [Sphingobacteriales bacterium]TAF81470.1 MAG: DoxX family membrane protein [Sphingobacteriales bacterium]